MESGLADKVVFITGASGGIGRALAEEFADESARLALTGNEAFGDLDKWVKSQGAGPRMIALKCDTTVPEQVDAAMEQARKHFGRVDACIANAGKWTPEFALAHKASPERIRRNIEVNLLGSMWTARAFMSALEKSGPRKDEGASLVFIGSTAGRFGEKGHAEYSAGKAGLYGLVRTLKNEIVDIDPFARVNMIEPGWTVTHMARPALQQPGVIAKVVRTMPLRQLARAKDIARTALYLCSPNLARHVSGEVITVAGGMEGRALWEPGDVNEDAIRARVGE